MIGEFEKNNTKDLCSPIFLYLLFLTSVDTVIFGTNINKAMTFVPRIVGVIAIFLMPLIKAKSLRRIKIVVNDLWSIICMLSIMIISSIINQEKSLTFISRIIPVLLAYVICHVYSEYDFFDIFDRFMYAIARIAIVVEIFAYIAPALIRLLPTVTNTANGVFYTFFLGSIQSSFLGVPLIRANGVFWEPGAFSIYLIFAVLAQFFIIERINIKRVVVYIIAIVITFSTAGYVSLGVLLVAFLFSQKTSELNKRVKGIIVLFIVVLIAAAILFDADLLYNSVFSKLTSGTSSATTRYSSVFNGIKVLLDHPIFGVASNSQDYMAYYVYSANNRYSNGGTIITNTIIGWSVEYGILWGIIFVIGSFKFLYRHSHKLYEWILLSLTMVLTYSGERLYSFLPFIFVFYGLHKHGEFKHENSRN